MLYKKIATTVLISFFIVACGNRAENKSPNFVLETNAKKNTFQLGDTLKLNINNKKDKIINSVSYSLNGKDIEENVVLKDINLGAHQIQAEIVSDENNTETLALKIIVNNNQKPKIYGFKILNEYPHDISSYTQGLEFHDGILYESTGQYNESKLRKLNFETGEVLKNVDLSDQYFGEGLTILNDKLYQLTWQSNTGFVYDLESFEKTQTFNYGKSKEGWGLCNDGTMLYKSDGTEAIYTLNPKSLEEQERFEVYTNNGKIASLNELEWVNGKIYANIYQRNGVVIINPENGGVEGVIDFSSLKEKVKQHPGLDVLNGIAYHPDRKTFFVTGKRWDKLFEVEIFEK